MQTNQWILVRSSFSYGRRIGVVMTPAVYPFRKFDLIAVSGFM
jgi:hypothetical protein